MIYKLSADSYNISVITYLGCTKEAIAMTEGHSLCGRSDSEVRKVHTSLASTHDVHISVLTKLFSRLETG
jgi:hypothetical protein